MKKFIFTLFFALLLISGFGQSNNSFNYQGVVRNSSGELIKNTPITIQISLLSGNAQGPIQYSESHNVTTNSFGNFTIQVGNGSLISGSFSNINWQEQFFLKTELANPVGATLVDLGTVQLLSVPYAIYAKNVENNDDADADPANELQNIAITGDTLSISNGNSIVLNYDSSLWVAKGENIYFNSGNVGVGSSNPASKLEVKSLSTNGALFQVINANNDTVFAVYPDGVKVFVDQSAKGSVGGFAVSGRTATKLGEKVEYFRVTPDSTRIYVNDAVNPKGGVGGFAVSGRTLVKGSVKDYFSINSDSARIYINDSASSKSSVGGFAVSGRTATKASSPANDYFTISGNSLVETVNDESRIIWYPKKEAFLTGRVLIESSDSVGTNSMATGFKSKSIGNYSQAFGYSARAKGNNSTAIGNNANAVGNESYAFGNYALTSDSGSYAIGTGAYSKGLRSFAIGSTGVDSLGNSTSPTKALGNYSYAFGMGSIATKKGAFAIGTQDTTAGDYSLTLGYQCRSDNWAGTAIGYRVSTSSGWFAIALGERTSATGTTAVSIGRMNLASGNISTAIGYNNLSSGPGASSFGANNESSGDYSMAIGYNTNATGMYAVSIGNGTTASALNSIAIGNGSIATFTDAIALGYQDTASANVSLATGRWTKASGIASFSAGDQTKASGQGAFSVGYATIASGFASIAAGSQSISSGSYSFATGYKTTATTFGTATFGYLSNATATYSIAAGHETTSQSYASLVIGRYNLIAGNTANWLAADPVFVIGNGTSTTARANALTILKNGRMAIGHDAPSEMLDINGNARIRSIASGTYLGPVNRTADGTLTTSTSDIRLKENISTLTNSLNRIMQIRGVNFSWIADDKKEIKIGFIAQEVQKVIPELVFVNPADGFYGVNYAEMTAVLVEAVKELKSENDDLRKHLNELNKRLEKLEK